MQLFAEDDDVTEADLQAENKPTVMDPCDSAGTMSGVADAPSNGRTSPKDGTTELPSVTVNTPKIDSPQSTAAPNSTEDPAFLEICQAFPDYSEDLLRSMLVCAAMFKIFS